ncbi:hypothetical protein D3C71_1135150 [compost metagenome]
MGDEADGFFRACPEFQKLFVQMVANDFVQCAKRFVHQQEIGVEGESSRDRGALLHAAGELPRVFFAEACKIDEIEGAVNAFLPLRCRVIHDLQRQRDILFDRAPGIKRRRLEDVAIGARFAGVFRRHAVDCDFAGCCTFEIGDDAQERCLAATGRADEGDEIASLHLQIDIGQGVNRPVARLESQAEFFRGNDGEIVLSHVTITLRLPGSPFVRPCAVRSVPSRWKAPWIRRDTARGRRTGHGLHGS